MRWCLQVVFCLVIAFALGCAPAPKKPPVAAVAVIVAKDVNPDVNGRPSPIIVRTYELKSLAAFDAAHVYGLLEKDKEVLGGDLLGRDELPLKPGERRELKKTLQADTRFFGVTAAFRDVEHSKWRATTPLPAKELSQIEIRVDRNNVSITAR
jgi:type VI secretion system protein VasD